VAKGFSAKRAKNVLELARELADSDTFFAEVAEMAEDWLKKYEQRESKSVQQVKRIIAVKMRVGAECTRGDHGKCDGRGCTCECGHPRKTVAIWHR
jgi:hypothetical protein